LINPH